MEDFDFWKVHRVMTELKWEWVNRSGGTSVPNVYQIIKRAEGLLRGVAQYYGDKEFHSISLGGFRASLCEGSLSLEFILTAMTAYDTDFIENEKQKEHKNKANERGD